MNVYNYVISRAVLRLAALNGSLTNKVAVLFQVSHCTLTAIGEAIVRRVVGLQIVCVIIN